MIQLDRALFLWLNLDPNTPPVWLELARFASLTLPQWLMVATVTLALAGSGNTRLAAWRALPSVALAAAMALALKPLFHLQRPFVMGLGTRWIEHAADGSFPSSHAAVMAALAATALLAPCRWPPKALALTAALLVSWSRPALGLHFPSDILAGWLLGLLAALAVRLVWVRVARNRR